MLFPLLGRGCAVEGGEGFAGENLKLEKLKPVVRALAEALGSSGNHLQRFRHPLVGGGGESGKAVAGEGTVTWPRLSQPQDSGGGAYEGACRSA